jgi:hypothetical protein
MLYTLCVKYSAKPEIRAAARISFITVRSLTFGEGRHSKPEPAMIPAEGFTVIRFWPRSS